MTLRAYKSRKLSPGRPIADSSATAWAIAAVVVLFLAIVGALL